MKTNLMMAALLAGAMAIPAAGMAVAADTGATSGSTASSGGASAAKSSSGGGSAENTGGSTGATEAAGTAGTAANTPEAQVGGTGSLPSQRITTNAKAGTGAQLMISPSGVREVQQMLNRLGYSAGPVDGVWNKATGDAMLHFQQAHALEPTGNLNVTSIAALGLWNRLIGNPLGTQMTPAEAMNSGMPPVRGRGAYGMNDMGSGQGGYGQGGYGQGAYGGGMGGYGDGMAGALPSQRIDMNGANGGSAGGGAGSSGTNR